MILQIDVTVTGSDGTTSSGSVAVDVTEPGASATATAAVEDPNAAMHRRSRATWGANRA
jgi:hypothetical protein